MSREIYRRIAPQLDRVRADGGVPTDRIADLIALQRWFEQDKDNIKLMYFPALTGNKIRTSGANKYVTKGYSFNSVPELGSELVINGNFDTDTIWVKSAGWTISGGTANASNSSSNIRQVGIVQKSKMYILTFTLSNYSSGSVRSVFGSDIGSYSSNYSANGTYTRYIYSDITSGSLEFYGTSFTGSIDNVSLQEVLNADLFQTTAINQPHLSGTIALNETLGIKNPNGNVSWLNHPVVGFLANQSWTYSFVLNANGKAYVSGGNADYSTFAGDNVGNGWIGYATTGHYFSIRNKSNILTFAKTIKQYIGKNTIITIVANGSVYDLYVNGSFIERMSGQTGDIDFRLLGYGSTIASRMHDGIIQGGILRSGAQSPTDVATEAALIRAVIPEIESVKISTQTWGSSNLEMATTPMGNNINEVQLATNVELITNAADRDFSSDTGYWTKSSGTTISGGVLNINEPSAANVIAKTLLTIGKKYKLQFEITSISSGWIAYVGIGGGVTVSATIGVKTYYFTATTTSAGLYVGGNTVATVDNISVQEVGASDSQLMYDNVYAYTQGTVEQKTYAALKAAAMWCHYNNDVALGAIYGKHYNWYAAALLAMDIAYYNAANPSTPWGWDVPTNTDFLTLQAYLGGEAVAGGKMKTTGLTYWTSPNTGATNESGLSIIGSGCRAADGSFVYNTIYSFTWSNTSASSSTAYKMRLYYFDTTMAVNESDKRTFFPIRLIKR